MRKFFSSLSILFLVVFSTQKSFSQDTIAAEVFTIPTCDPINSIIHQGGKNITVRKPVRLEANSKIASVLRITGINPLRYKYFINNQAVTQFMETSPFTFSVNNFSDGSYFATAPDIHVPEIFKTDSVLSKTRGAIREYRNKNKQYEEAIDTIQSQLNEIWYKAVAKDSNYEKQNRLYYADEKRIPLEIRLQKIQILHNKNLKEYQMYAAGLPLNNPEFGILQLYKNSNTDSSKGVRDIDLIRLYKKTFATEYCADIAKFKKIDSILFTLETDGRYLTGVGYNPESLIHDLKIALSNYNFVWAESNSINYPQRYNPLTNNINDVKEQILNKQFQIWEEFVLNLATRVGVLIQNKFREHSSFDNALKYYSCLNDSSLAVIDDRRKKLDSTFEFIQRTNAELQTLVPYLNINTELYQSIAKKINANYFYLLGYLKNLNFASRENSVQYTLPTHNNLKNIDLIRYTVKREDRDDKTIRSTQEYNYDFWLKGGLKIDFSFGMFATRLTDNVYNKVLLDTAGGMDKIRITRQDDGRASFSFGGMLNITPRNGAKWLNVGGSVGVAYSDNKTLQVLTGLSLHFGKTERLILHAGAGFGTIKYLDISANDFKFFDRDLKSVVREKLNDVKERDRVYMLQSKDIKFTSFTIPTVNKFVIRPFIGITYNLSGKNVLKAVSSEGYKTFKDNLNGNP